VTLSAVTLAPEGLTLWLGPEFAAQSTFVMQCLAVGVFLNGLAQVPSALTQGVGRPDLTFKLHLLELAPYLAIAMYLIRTRGIEGAALAWTARTALDFVLFFWAGRHLLPESAAAIRKIVLALGVALPLFVIGGLPLGLSFRLPYLTLTLATAAVAAWRLVLGP